MFGLPAYFVGNPALRAFRPLIGEYTTDLMNLLHVLGRLVLLEPRQAGLLEQVLDKPLLSVAELGLAADNEGQAKKDDNGPA